MFLSLLFSQWVSTALAGDLQVDAAGPVELREGGKLLVQSWGPEKLVLSGLRVGPHLVEVVAGGKARTQTIEVPASGAARLNVSGATVSVDTLPPGPPLRPVLELRSASDDSFALILDGQRRLLFSREAQVQLYGLAPGEHALEIRSADLTTIWSRGTLALDNDGRVTATAARGQALDVFGPDGAWAPGVGGPSASLGLEPLSPEDGK